MIPEEAFRWILLAVLVAGVGTSGYYRHRARQSGETIPRGKESPALIAARLLIGLPLLLSLLAFLIHPGWMAWSRVPAPPLTRWLGALLGVLTLPFILWVMRSIGRNVSETVLTKQDHQLVQHGPYQWIRHPIYTSGILLLSSAALMMSNWFVAGLTALMFLAFRFGVIPIEESALIAKFGERYRQYRTRTGALLPKVFR